MLHCPSLDTSSGAPVNTGMNTETANGSNDGVNASVGMAGWDTVNQQVAVGYLYRAKSYALTHSNGTIRTNIAKSNFAITADLVTDNGDTGAARYGRRYHHVTGWNVSFGDGHNQYVADPEGPAKVPGNTPVATWVGRMERDVAGGNGTTGYAANNIHGGDGGTANDANALATERVFKWLGTPTPGKDPYK